jgi:hypothetical protein
MNVVTQVLLVLFLFFFAGLEKIFSFSKTTAGFKSKVGLPYQMCALLIIGAIILEVVAPVITFYSAVTNKNKMYAKLALYSLIVFTVVVTAIYHGDDPGAILKNMCVIGGLTLLIDKLT